MGIINVKIGNFNVHHSGITVITMMLVITMMGITHVVQAGIFVMVVMTVMMDLMRKKNYVLTYGVMKNLDATVAFMVLCLFLNIDMTHTYPIPFSRDLQTTF